MKLRAFVGGAVFAAASGFVRRFGCRRRSSGAAGAGWQSRRSPMHRPRFTTGPAFISARMPAPAWRAPRGAIHSPEQTTFSIPGPGFLGGGQVGANYQLNTIVLGVEGDFSWTGFKGSGADCHRQHDQHKYQLDVDHHRPRRRSIRPLADLRQGRRGVRPGSKRLDRSRRQHAGTTFTRTGWTVGAGLEYGISENWSAKIEYDYLSFAPQALNFTTPLQPAYATNAGLNIQEVKAGLNFRFGGP